MTSAINRSTFSSASLLPSRLPWAPPAAGTTRDAIEQAAYDPPQPAGRNGWTPATVTPVESRLTHGFAGTALNLAIGSSSDVAGQRLSLEQIDALAPYFAQTYGLDEGYVRDHLAQVYVYVGGPATNSQAMTIGHHVYVPDARSLTSIMSRDNKRWLVHELSHTMQFLAHDDASPHRFLATYLKGLFVGRNPSGTGAGDGGFVWGALFTGMRVTGKNAAELGERAQNAPDRFGLSVLPAVTLGVPLTVAAAGALAATRATTNLPLLGRLRSLPTAAAVIAGPALIGAGIGATSDTIGKRQAQVGATVASGGLAGLVLWRAGAFRQPALAAGAVAGAALIGLATSTATANSVAGWSRTARTLTDLRRNDIDPDSKLTYPDALHDAHWMELDAETSAQRYIRGQWTPPTDDDRAPVQGRTPASSTHRPGTLDRHDQIDWGIINPLILGIPAAGAVGTGVLGARIVRTVFSPAVTTARGPRAATIAALHSLGTIRRGVGNSLGIGAALTLAPLMVGGIAGPIIDNVTGSATAARFGGAGLAAATSGVMLPWLLRRGGAGTAFTVAATAAGASIAAGVGLLSAGLAAGASRRTPDQYLVAE